MNKTFPPLTPYPSTAFPNVEDSDIGSILNEDAVDINSV